MSSTMITFKNGDEVRLLYGTPSQRAELWVVDDPSLEGGDLILSRIAVHRSSDADSRISAPRAWIEHSTVLDLLVAHLDESGGDRTCLRGFGD